jgi:hypothetical protein
MNECVNDFPWGKGCSEKEKRTQDRSPIPVGGWLVKERKKEERCERRREVEE